MAINSFRGNYNFLSNFYNAPVTYNGVKFRNNEAAFQAQKDVNRAHEFANLTGADAKRLGRHVNLRSDWNSVRIRIMTDIVRAKFTQNSDLKQRLLATSNEDLIEGNTWHDTFWGVCNGQGQNNLGKILMQIRSELR